jgi:hypothetical protein
LDRTAERGGQFIRCHRGSQLCDQCNSSAGRRELAGRAAEAERRRRGKIRRSNFNVIWSAACTAAGVPDAHFHDYADTCLMPMSGGSACSAVVSGLKMSA